MAPSAPTRTAAVPVSVGGPVTRIDATHPGNIVGTQDIGRRLRVQQLRHAAAIGFWLTVIVLIVLVVFIGSQPAAPNF